MRQYIQYAENNKEVIEWINNTLKSYCSKNEVPQGEIEHILDYLKSDNAPKRLRKMSYEQAKLSTQKWTAALIKRAGNILETEEDTEVVLDFKNGVKLVKLVGKAAYMREGNLMRHCVGSYHDKKDTSIYSIRDANNKPHVTLELVGDSDTIHQVKGKGNGCIHPRYIKYVLRSLKHLGVQVRESEMTYLGYNNLEAVTEGLTKFIESRFDVKYIMMNNKKFIYMNSIKALK